jgi:hypothetical protein
VKDFAAGPGRLRVLSVSAKVLYTAFLFAALTGLLVSWKLYGAAVGEAGPRAYYAGEVPVAAASAVAAPAADVGGPSLDLPQEIAAKKPMVEQISDRRLLEVTHFHVFTIPIFVLVIAHLWLLTRLPSWVHSGGVSMAVASSAVHVAGPWIVRGHPALSPLMPISAITMLLVLAGMSIASGIDMWMPRANKKGSPEPSAGISGEGRRSIAT